MKPEPKWLSRKALLLLHEQSLATFGGARGIRDDGLLDSALARPRNICAYRKKNALAELAAAYAYGLAKNHPFVDGNKRAAFLAIGVFLEINGYRLQADPVEAVQAIQALAAGTLKEKELSAWIAGNSGLKADKEQG